MAKSGYCAKAKPCGWPLRRCCHLLACLLCSLCLPIRPPSASSSHATSSLCSSVPRTGALPSGPRLPASNIRHSHPKVKPARGKCPVRSVAHHLPAQNQGRRAERGSRSDPVPSTKQNRGRCVVSYPLHGSSSQALKGAEQHMTLILAYPLDASNPTSLLDSCLRLL